MSQQVKLTFLGTGTSTGVPLIGCGCPTCTSRDVRDKRLRASVLVRYKHLNLLIDPGPDFRYQMLRQGAPAIDTVLITHSHYDHVGGIDDLRPYCNRQGQHMPIFCTEDVANDLRHRVPYCFKEHPYPGVPHFDLRIITPGVPFEVAEDVKVLPIPVMHGPLPIVGYRFGPLAYITDCSTLTPEAKEMLKGCDVLVVNALRLKEHFSHMSLAQSLELISELQPRRAYLTHVSHDMPRHTQVCLPRGVQMAYDTLSIEAT